MSSNAILCVVMHVVVIDVVVWCCVNILSGVESRGCCIYRGNAAQVFIDKCWLRLKILSLMNSNWQT